MKLKKNSFMQGAFIATFGIVLCKIIGMLYVIPFYAMVGTKGGALYGYAYSIYSIFLGISSAGIPLAMSKIISEYNALGYYNVKERAFSIGQKFLSIIGIAFFIILFIFAEPIANTIIGDVTGGNTVEDVTLVIRLISTAILIVPSLSVYRGYLQGHLFLTPPSISQVIEQIVRVGIIIIGSYVIINILQLPTNIAVGVAVFSATPAALISYLYLKIKAKRNKQQLLTKEKEIEEPKITDKEILKKILLYAFPFVIIDVSKNIYNSVDVMMLVKLLVNNLNYLAQDAETVMSVISTWGLKINMIVISISTGVITSLIPNISESFIKKDMDKVNNRINKSLQILIYLTVPMVIGLSFLTEPVWTIFYGSNALCVSVYKYYVFVCLSTIFFTVTITIVQLMKEYKQVIITLITGLTLKIVLNIPFVYLFDKLGLPAYYGSITTTIIGFTTAGIISLIFLNRKFKITYKETLQKAIKSLVGTFIMLLTLIILKMFIPLNVTSRATAIIVVIIYTLIGAIVYFAVTICNGAFKGVFGDELIKKIKNKLNRT